MPALIAAGIGGVASLAGSLIGNSTANNAMDAAQAATQKAVDAINAVGASPDLAKQIFLQQYQQAGILTPEIEQNINAHFQSIAGPSSQVTNAQNSALSQLAQQSQAGLTPTDRLALAQVQQQSAKQGQAAQGAIMQNLAMQGLTGQGVSGAGIAAKLGAAQNASNQGAMQGLQIGANSSQEALQALAQMGNQANTMNSQQFSQNQAQANIQNEQNRFNTQNQLATQQQNVQTQNAAQAANLANKQAISNANTSQANQEAQREVAAQQTMYQNAMQHAQGVANAYTGQGQQTAQFGQNKAGATTGMFGGLASAAAGIGSYLGNQPASPTYETTGGYDNMESQGNLGMGPTVPGSSSGIGSYATYGPANGQWQGGLIHQMFNGGGVNSLPAGYNSGGYVENEYHDGGAVHDMRDGGQVPGQAKVPGDSPQNDTVPAMLSPGEYVVPRSEMAKIKDAGPELDHSHLRDLLKIHETAHKAAKKMAKGGSVNGKNSNMPQIQQPMQGMRPQAPMQNPQASGAGILAQLIAPGLQKGAGRQMQPVKPMSDGGPVYGHDDYSYGQQGMAHGGMVPSGMYKANRMNPMEELPASGSGNGYAGGGRVQLYDDGGPVVPSNGLSSDVGPSPTTTTDLPPDLVKLLAQYEQSKQPPTQLAPMSSANGDTTDVSTDAPPQNPELVPNSGKAGIFSAAGNALGVPPGRGNLGAGETPEVKPAELDKKDDSDKDTEEDTDTTDTGDTKSEAKVPSMAPMEAKAGPDYLAMLKDAQGKSNTNMLNANLLKAYQQSLGAAGRRPADYSLADSLEKQASGPVDQLSQTIKVQDAAQKMQFNKEMDDPNSDTSKFTQALANKYGIDPSKTAGVPASALSKLIPALGTASYREALINSKNTLGAAKNEKSENKDLNGFITKARTEGQKQSQGYDELNKATNILENGIKNPNSINDIASFYASAKAFNPKAIVRSQSVKLEQQAMGPWKNLQNKIQGLAGGQIRLSDTGVQEDMLKSINELKQIAAKDRDAYRAAVIQQGKKGYKLPDERINEIFPDYQAPGASPAAGSPSGQYSPQQEAGISQVMKDHKLSREDAVKELTNVGALK